MAKTTSERPPRTGLPRARKRFGQHFLEPAWVNKLIDAVRLSPTDTVLEIGPGRGALTMPLVSRVERLIAVEIDRDLSAALAERLPPHARVVCRDLLQVDPATLFTDESLPVRVVGNLPYNVSSPILFWLLHHAQDGARFSDATVMLQREVAERLVARPGDRDYGALAVQAALGADCTRVLELPPGAFRPPPKVHSTVVRLTFRPPTFEVGDPTIFEALVRGAFQHRRKTLANALGHVVDRYGVSASELLERARLDGTKRPEALSPSDFGQLAKAVL